MKLVNVVIIVLIFVNSNMKGQEKDKYLFNSFEFGSSFTAIDVGYTQNLCEFTWNINFASSIGKRFYLGVQVLNIFIDYPNIETKTYNIFGLFSQYYLAPKSKIRPFLELSINKGNYYLPRYSNYPAKDIRLFYVGLGGGADIPLTFVTKRLFLDLSFIFYLLKNENKIAGDIFNQYIIGINYRFGKGQD